MTNEEKRSICILLRRETGCGLLEASASIDKLVEVLKNRPLTVMDKPSHLKITWENLPQEIEIKLVKDMENNIIQQRPKDEEVSFNNHSKLSDYIVDIFKGCDLHETKPDFLGDYKHVKFFDKTVENKIEDNKYYKCWYDYGESSDPADSSKYYYFVYVEEVPDEIVKIIESKKILAKYMREK